MFLVKFYAMHLFITGGFLNVTYAMLDRAEKNHPQSVRSERQIRPVLNSIIFLLAANLAAKGALGLSGFQSTIVPNNIQGFLHLTLNSTQPHQLQQQVQIQQPVPLQQPIQIQQPVHLQQPLHLQQVLPLWFPVSNQIPHLGVATTPQPPRPVTQNNFINIHESLYDELLDENYQDIKDTPHQHIIIQRNNKLNDIIPAASEEDPVVAREAPEECTKDCDPNTSSNNNTPTELPDKVKDVEVLSLNLTDMNPLERQVENQTNVSAAAMPSTSLTAPNATNNLNATGPYPGSQKNENVSLTTTGPLTANQTVSPFANNTGLNATYGPPEPGYNYYPKGDYGPLTGNEHISITYGPPVYQKPFFSSPEDPFLNSYKQNYNNFYSTSPTYNSGYKYNDVFNRFYNKFNYQYPSFYSNYLGK